MPPVQQHRANNFDALRLAGALMVLFSHQFALVGLPEPMVHTWSRTSFGSLGVYLFFAISGHLVCQSWQRDPNADRFIRRRFLRIWPGMAAAILLSSAFFWMCTPAQLGTMLRYWANAVTPGFSQGPFFPGNAKTTLWGSLWTIPVEVQCYITLMAAGMALGTRMGAALIRVAVAGILLATAWPMLVPLLFDVLWSMGWAWPSAATCVAFFVVGAACSVRESLHQRPWLAMLCGALMFANDRPVLALVIALPPAVVWVGTRSWPVLRSAGRFGDLSYGIYLWAWPVQQAVAMWAGKGLGVWQQMGITLPATVLLALASWHLIEKRALRLKPQAAASGAVVSPDRSQALNSASGSAVTGPSVQPSL